MVQTSPKEYISKWSNSNPLTWKSKPTSKRLFTYQLTNNILEWNITEYISIVPNTNVYFVYIFVHIIY